MEQSFTLNSQQEQEMGEAKEATKERDAAIEAVSAWLSDFKTVARIAVEDKPQFLQALYISVGS